MCEIGIDEPVVTHDQWSALFLHVTGYFCFFDNFQTVRECEINSFTNIEPLWETTVVSFEKSADVFLRSLVCFVDFDAIIEELERVDHVGDTI